MNKKISQLPLINTVEGSDILPIVHSNVTYKLPVSAITESNKSTLTGETNYHIVNLSGTTFIKSEISENVNQSFGTRTINLGDKITITNTGHTISGNTNINGSLNQGFFTDALGEYSHAEGAGYVKTGVFVETNNVNYFSVDFLDNSGTIGVDVVGVGPNYFTVNGDATLSGFPSEFKKFTLFDTQNAVIVYDVIYTIPTIINIIYNGETNTSNIYFSALESIYYEYIGNGSISIGDYSHVEGVSNKSIGVGSHVEGYNTYVGVNFVYSGTVLNGVVTIDSSFGDVSGEFDNNNFQYLLIYDKIFDYNYGHVTSKITGITFDSVNTIVYLEDTTLSTTNAYVTSFNIYSDAVPTNLIIPTNYSHAEGTYTISFGEGSHAEGYGTISIGEQSHAEGSEAVSHGNYSHAEGSRTESHGSDSHSEGYLTKSYGQHSHSEGYDTKSLGESSHTEGYSTNSGCIVKLNIDSIVDGLVTISSVHGDLTSYIFSEIFIVVEPDQFSQYYLEGDPEDIKSYPFYYSVQFDGTNTKLQLNNLITYTYGYGMYLGLFTQSGGEEYPLLPFTPFGGNYSHSEGRSTISLGESSHAEGSHTTSSGVGSHAEGVDVISFGKYSHAEGEETKSLGYGSHSEGRLTQAIGDFSHSEGRSTRSHGESSHAEGYGTYSFGQYSHAEGESAIASGYSSHAEGFGTIAEVDFQHVSGKYNTTGNTSSNISIIGCGTDGSNRADAVRVDIISGTTATLVLPQVLLLNYVDDDTAGANGVPIGGLYHTDGVLKIRREPLV